MRISLLASALVSLLGGALRAQTVETPVPFDSAQRLLALTPALAERLGLRPPVWPVVGAYTETRLYSIAPGDAFTLVVLRSSGAIERIPLSSADRGALRIIIDSAMKAAGRPTADVASNTVSEPAGNAFARRLTLLSAFVYAPLASSLATDGRAAGGLYLLTTGLTYFVSYGAAQSTPFTRAQSDLAGDLGLAGTAAGLLTGYAISGEGNRGVRAVGLAGGLIGTLSGVAAARGMSDAEAHAAMMGVHAGAAFGVLAASPANKGQSFAIGAVAGGALGYPLGLLYPRRAGYTVTAGDAEAIGTAALIGGVWSGTTLHDGVRSSRVAATLSAGYLLGGFVGERLLARPFNLTRTQSNVLAIGAVAGGLVGLAVPVLADDPAPALTAGAIAAGATIAVAALANSFPRAASASKVGSANPGNDRLRFSLSPMSALAAANHTPGRHAIVSITF